MLKAHVGQRALCAVLVSAVVHLAAGTVMVGEVGAGPPPSAAHAARLTVRLDRTDAPAERQTDAAAQPAAQDAVRGVRPDDGPHAAAASAPSAGLLPPVQPFYYPGSALDRRPHPITAVALEEPGPGVPQGYLILRLLINEAGELDDAVVVVNDGSPELAHAAREAFSKARYAPGMRNGEAVKSEMVIEVKLDRAAG